LSTDRHDILTLRDHVLKNAVANGLGLVPWTTPMLDKVPDMLVPGLLQEEAIHVLSADSGTCKSWLGLSLMLSGLFGVPVLGQLPTKPFSSIYLAADSPRWDIGQQLRKLHSGLALDGLKPFEDTHAFVMPIGFLFDNSDHVNLIRDVALHWDINAMFIDVMLYAHSGDENDNSYMARAVLSAAKYLRDVAHLAVYFIHHNSKPKDGFPSGFRGAGTIIQAAEHHFTSRRLRDKTFALSVKKIRGEEIIAEDLHYELARSREGRKLSLVDEAGPSLLPPAQTTEPSVLDIIQQLQPVDRDQLLKVFVNRGAKYVDNQLQYLKSKGAIQREGKVWTTCPV
jgi:hypothetical protein